MDGLYVMLGVRIRLYCGALECQDCRNINIYYRKIDGVYLQLFGFAGENIFRSHVTHSQYVQSSNFISLQIEMTF